jgi:hypothetical protein
MVALTYDVRTVRIPVPRIVLPVRSPRTPARRTLQPWQRAERVAAERRLAAHRAAALAAHR